MNGPWWEGPLVGFDTETSGVDPESCRIVTACVVLDEPGREPKSWTWLLNPGVDIPEAATAVHGVTTEHARDHGMDAEQGVQQIINVLAGFDSRPLVVFNAAFDLTLLDRESRRHGFGAMWQHEAVIDPMVLDKQVDPYRKGKRTLSVTCEHYGVELGEAAHDASADALAAVGLARAIGRREPHPPADATVLHRGQVIWRAQQQSSLADYFRSVGKSADDVDGSWPVRPGREAVTR